MAKGTYVLSEGPREPPQLNWAGEPIREWGYGGRPENIPETWSRKLAQVASKQQHYAITEKDVCQVFANGALTLAQAAKLLELLTGAHRTTCYRALKLDGPFARHLHADGTTLSWR